MKYPKFLSNNATIGIVALSAGVGKYLSDYEKSLSSLKKNNFQITETKSVRTDKIVSASAKQRAKELNILTNNKDVALVMCATGGDFAIEIMPYINWDSIAKNLKWYMGASDPTSLLYTITTKLDIATIYGFNACSFDFNKLHKSQQNALELIKGNLITQKSYPLYEKNRETRLENAYNLTEKVYWKSLNHDNINLEGRLIGGCLDCIRDLIGTKYDYTKDFLKRYQDDGIIWYFDVFSLSAEDFYRTLFQMQQANYFAYTKGVIVGRVMYETIYTPNFSYEKALKKIFSHIPVIFNADIGHTAPKMTLINGAYTYITCQNGQGSIKFELK